jgi:DHA1 family tetracycline resistance protein-like MFS transporter
MNNRKASLTFIFITILVDVIGIGIIIPVIPALIQDLGGGTISDASFIGGMLMASFAVMQFLFAPLFGELSDRFGRRPIILWALLGLGLDYLFHAFAPTLTWLFIGRLLAGVTGASFTVATAYIADISTPENKAKNFGLIGAAFGLGFIIGPAIGGFAGEWWGPQAPFFIAAGITLLNLVYGYFILPESLPPEKRRAFNWRNANPWAALKHLRKYPLVRGFILPLLCLYIAGFAVQGTWTFYTELRYGWGELMVGLSLTCVGVFVAIVQGGLLGTILKWLGSKKTIIVGFCLWIVGILLFAAASEGWMLFVFMAPYVLGGIAGPALQGIMSNSVPENEQGELQGGLTSLMSITSVIGPLVMTWLFFTFTQDDAPVHFPGAPFILGAVLLLVGLLLTLKPLKLVKDDHKGAVDPEEQAATEIPTEEHL